VKKKNKNKNMESSIVNRRQETNKRLTN